MKVKVEKLEDSKGSLASLAALKIKGPVKTRIARVVRQVEAQMEAHEKVKEERAEHFGVLKEEKPDGKVFEFPDEAKRKEFMAELKEMREQEVDIIFDTFELKQLEDLDLSAFDLINLEWLYGGLPEDKAPEEPAAESGLPTE